MNDEHLTSQFTHIQHEHLIELLHNVNNSEIL